MTKNVFLRLLQTRKQRKLPKKVFKLSQKKYPTSPPKVKKHIQNVSQKSPKSHQKVPQQSPNIAKKGSNGGQIWPNSDANSWDPLFGRMQIVGNDYPVEYNYIRLISLFRILHYPVTNLSACKLCGNQGEASGWCPRQAQGQPQVCVCGCSLGCCCCVLSVDFLVLISIL